MNILIKLTCLVGLAIAPILGHHSASSTDNIKMQIRENRLPQGMSEPPATVGQKSQPAGQQSNTIIPAGAGGTGTVPANVPGQTPPGAHPAAVPGGLSSPGARPVLTPEQQRLIEETRARQQREAAQKKH